MLKLLDLFSGIGGFSLAARWTGAIETVAFCEIDPFCQKVLKKHWPNTPIISDIREVTGERVRRITSNSTEQGLPESRPTGIGELSEEESKGVHNRPEQQNRWIASDTIDKGLFGGCRGSDTDRNGVQTGEQTGDIARGATARCDENHIDILTGGFPCQPFSCAGKRKGTEDNRFLWPEMLRVIRQVKPTWVIAENVRGLLSIDNGVVFEKCCSEMEALGYEVQPFVIPACAVNAPHRRDRVWIVGYAASCAERKKQKICEGQSADSARGVEPDRHAPDTECGEQLWGYENGSILRERETREVNSGDIVDAPDTDLPRSQGRDEHGERAGERSFGPGHTEQWAEDWYTVALRTCVRDLDDGVSGKLAGRHRVSKLKALGNAIVPQVAYEILKTITEINNDRHLNAN